MLCQDCKKKTAVVHMTEITNNKKVEFHLCYDCAHKKDGLSLFAPYSINEILAAFLGSDGTVQSVGKKEIEKCSTCGIEYAVFKKTGRLGCADCYHSFRNHLLPLIKRVHASTIHAGKLPRRLGQNQHLKQNVSQLKNKLANAIIAEDYESAAALRDQIRSLESQPGNL